MKQHDGCHSVAWLFRIGKTVMKSASFWNAVAIAASTFVCLPDAAAYAWHECDGVKVKWEGEMLMFQNIYSIPSGSDRESAYANAVDRWNGVRGMNDMIAKVGTTFFPSITHGDEINDVAVVAPA